MDISYTITQNDETVTYSISSTGSAGPNIVTTDTTTTISGLLKGASGNVAQAIEDTDYQGVPAEGAFADGDKTKLDGIEAGADVTDATNVDAAGAVMESDLVSDGAANPDTALKSDANSSITLKNLNLDGTIPSVAEGDIYYDGTEKTHVAINDITSSALNIGHEAWVRVVNNTGSPIANGQAVYINGNDVPTGLPTIALAQADSSSTANVVGVTTGSIADGAEGLVTAWGKVRDLNTSSFSNGDLIYLSPSVAGGFTNTKPTRPDRIVEIGFVTKAAGGTNGTITVNLLEDNDSLQPGTVDAEDLDYDNSTDIGAALADADEIMISDGGGNATRRKSAISRLYTYIKSKLDGNITLAGTKDFTGQVSLTGQTASDDDAAMTRSLVDARSGVNYYLKENGATTSNSTSYVNSSETVVLPAGTYRYSGTVFAYTASTTGGINLDITGLTSTERLHRNSIYWHTSTSTVLSVINAPVEDNLQVRTDIDNPCNGFMDGSTSDRQIIVTSEGYFMTGSEQTLRFRVAQRTATDASNPAVLKSAFVLFEKLA